MWPPVDPRRPAGSFRGSIMATGIDARLRELLAEHANNQRLRKFNETSDRVYSKRVYSFAEISRSLGPDATTKDAAEAVRVELQKIGFDPDALAGMTPRQL